LSRAEVCLIGAGGHAKAVVEAIRAGDHRLATYVDPRPASWLDVPRVSDSEARIQARAVALGIGGLVPSQLKRRLALLDEYLAAGLDAPPVIHPRAHVSPSARIDRGATILAGSIVQPGATVGRGAILNSGAILEHDSVLGEGAHAAPGAVVLADCAVGACTMIGAGAVVLRGVVVPANVLIRAVSLYRGPRGQLEDKT
jgi:sugar O-acyltransferase (sialic acid O-acetyltransferase NeuD family)